VGLQLLDSCTAAILNLRSSRLVSGRERERFDETQSAGCDLLGNPHRAVATRQILAATVTMFYQIHAACITDICTKFCNGINPVIVPLHGMKSNIAVEILFHPFLSYALYEDERSLSRRRCFTHEEITPPSLKKNEFYKALCGLQCRSALFG
jgi:hypothetical protein